MRVVVNEAHIQRNRTISHVLFFVSLAGMVGGFIYTWSSNNSSASQISCMILPLLLFLTLTSVRMANAWIREPRPNDVLEDALKGLGQKYSIFHYLFPAPHVLIGPEGVFTLTVFWHEKSYRVAGKRWYAEAAMMQRLLGFMRQDLLGNPYQEAVFHAKQMQRLVEKVAPGSDIEVQPLIVFTSPNVRLEIEDPIIPVLYADSKRKPSLRGYLRDQKSGERATLTLKQMDEIDRLYGLITRQQLEGYDPEDDAEDDADETAAIAPDAALDEAEVDADDEDEALGTIYVVKAGQLCRIGVVETTLDDAVNAIKEEAEQDVEVIHSFVTTDPEATEAYLHRKYDRKRQKEVWFGLSKKDIEWIQNLQGELK
ncbi:MAG: hypothetical protein GYB65_08030 [Chloroflexi bacterium]|nr:hypothetical protein [Chloroflexota bacterium]